MDSPLGWVQVKKSKKALHKSLLAVLITSLCNTFDIIGLYPRRVIWVMKRGKQQPWHVDDFDKKGGVSVLLWLGTRKFYWIDELGRPQSRTGKAGDISVLVGPVYHRGGNTDKGGDGILVFMFFDTDPMYIIGTGQQGFKQTEKYPMVPHHGDVPEEVRKKFKHISTAPSLFHVVGHLYMASRNHGFLPQ